MKRVVLGLGSNKTFNGISPLQNLHNAYLELSSLILDIIPSSVYITKAMYVEDQNDFFNMAVLGFVSDDKSPFELLNEIHIIEEKLGRNRSTEIRFGPRSIDIDIELFGDDKIETENLIVPHPRIKERAFVLVPTIEVLKNTADVIIREKYLSFLRQIDCNTVKKTISAHDFLSL
jgi:2-amino-4-hydroxy-6-hydroxymethyldihydropteridine diphosphokinase